MIKLPDLKRGKFVKRYKRFFTDINIGESVIIAHNPNTGSMSGLLEEDCIVAYSESDNPKRKLKYTVEAFFINNHWIYTNTVNVNRVVENALQDGEVKEFKTIDFLKREFKYHDSRIDFMIESNNKKILLEVKNVTLLKGDIAMFPDAKTERGKKHLITLIKSISDGYTPYMLYVIGVNGSKFECAADIDPEYAEMWDQAVRSGVKMLYYHSVLDVDGSRCWLKKM